MGLGPQFEQLSMFMTPRHIMEDYAPLKGDKDEVSVDSRYSRLETDAELWERKGEEASVPRSEYVRQPRREADDPSLDKFLASQRKWKYRINRELGTGTGVPYRTGHTATFERERVDNKNTEVSADRTWEAETSLVDSIRESGVQMPVRVGPSTVTGGHHRIAAAHSINPDMLIPVLHEPEDVPIKSNKSYPYT